MSHCCGFGRTTLGKWVALFVAVVGLAHFGCTPSLAIGAPGKASSPSPTNEGTNVSLNTTLGWRSGTGATSSDVFFGTSEALTSANFRANTAESVYNPGTLAPNQMYYWRVDSKNALGTTKGDTWRFRTAVVATPEKATDPSPADGATDQAIDTRLSWRNGGGALGYYVYFGSSETPEYVKATKESAYDPGELAPGQTYYWRINPANANGQTAGDVWSFSTANAVGERSLTLMSPSGGTAWRAGTTQELTWTSVGEVGETVRISLYRGDSFSRLIAETAPNSGSFSWTLPTGLTPGENYVVRIASVADPTVYDRSEEFSISAQQAAIAVTAPTRESVWKAGTRQMVTWSNTGQTGSLVRVTLYRGDSFKGFLTESTANDRSFFWDIPATLATGSDYRVLVTSLSDPSCTDISDFFTVAGPSSDDPKIDVTSPMTGWSWKAGSAHVISWKASGAVGSLVRVTLYQGGVFKKVIADPTANDGSFNWIVPFTQTPGSGYQVKVTSIANSACSDLSGNFNVVAGDPHGSLDLTAPNGASVWKAGTSQAIKWTTEGPAGANVRLTLYRGGVFKRVMAESTPNDGSFTWSIPSTQTPAEDYRVKITSLSDSTCFDLSSDFVIAAAGPTMSISITKPDFTTIWQVGTSRNITWRSEGAVGASVRITLYNGNVFKKVLAESTANDGSFSWAIPGTQPSGEAYRVKITSLAAASCFDVSDAFAITTTDPPAASLKVTWPGVGASWQQGTSHTLTWVSTGEVGPTVKITLYKGTILQSTLAWAAPNKGSFAWKVPAGLAAGGDYRVRVSSVSEPGCKGDSSLFRITLAPPSLRVVFPNGGEELLAGAKYGMRWATTGNTGPRARVTLYRSGVYRATLITSTANDGSCSVTLPAWLLGSSKYRVRVTAVLGDREHFDYSDAHFTVVNASDRLTREQQLALEQEPEAALPKVEAIPVGDAEE